MPWGSGATGPPGAADTRPPSPPCAARVVHAIRRRLRGAEPLDAWGRRASEEAAVVLGTRSFAGRGYSDNDSAYLAVITAARTREYPDAA
jgi:hypothetical protein